MECSGRWEEWDAGKGEVREGTCRRGRTGKSVGWEGEECSEASVLPFLLLSLTGQGCMKMLRLTQFGPGNYTTLCLQTQDNLSHESSIVMNIYGCLV